VVVVGEVVVVVGEVVVGRLVAVVEGVGVAGPVVLVGKGVSPTLALVVVGPEGVPMVDAVVATRGLTEVSSETFPELQPARTNAKAPNNAMRVIACPPGPTVACSMYER